MIFTFEDITFEDLSWFIKPWEFEFGYVDFELKNVKSEKGMFSVTIDKIGSYPAPIDIKIIYTDSSEDIVHKSAGIGQLGNNTYIFKKESDKKILAVELLNKLLLDADE